MLKRVGFLAAVVALSACTSPNGFVKLTKANPSDPEVLAAFEQYDCNRDGWLTFQEMESVRFGAKVADRPARSDAQYFEADFTGSDQDKNGGLDRDEYANLWVMVGGIAIPERLDGGCAK